MSYFTIFTCMLSEIFHIYVFCFRVVLYFPLFLSIWFVANVCLHCSNGLSGYCRRSSRIQLWIYSTQPDNKLQKRWSVPLSKRTKRKPRHNNNLRDTRGSYYVLQPRKILLGIIQMYSWYEQLKQNQIHYNEIKQTLATKQIERNRGKYKTTRKQNT
jgi:hypothetical protein